VPTILEINSDEDVLLNRNFSENRAHVEFNYDFYFHPCEFLRKKIFTANVFRWQINFFENVAPAFK
jgi:hypothetical protein